MKNAMIVAGVMSGTSADGVNVAVVRVQERRVSDPGAKQTGAKRAASRSKRGLPGAYPTFELLGHAEFAYPKRVRMAVLAAMNASQAAVADLARLNFLLGELYADAVLAIERRCGVKVGLVGCHGQTLYHQGEARRFLGRMVSATWQTGEAAVLAARVGAPVVADFRPADMAAGGKGAPLVPYLDYLLFRNPRVGRIAQNIGGIANLTAIPAGAAAPEVMAFDTGPGNMVMDAVAEKLFGCRFDRDGKIAASGTVVASVVDEFLRRDFFRAKPPKTAGREEFGREFVKEFLRSLGRRRPADVVATATALTARSIADGLRRHVLPGPTSPRPAFREMILSGGGARNATLVAMLKNEVEELGLDLRFSDDYGLPSEAKEAVAFALLAHETWRRRPSNMVSATGARHSAVLGKVAYPWP